jgi:hypothetical protein
VLARRERLVILAIAFAPMGLLVVSGALVALDTARRGVAQGTGAAALAFAGFMALVLAVGGEWPLFALLGGIAFAAGVAVGALLRWAGNLVLAFQAAVLAAFAIAVVLVFVPAPQQAFGAAATEAADWLVTIGATAEQVAPLRENGAKLLLEATVFSQLLAPLLLGYWWLTLAEGSRTFGAEFRALKLGRWLGGAATVFLVLSLVVKASLVQNLAVLGLTAFLLQGFAVLHAWFFARGLNGAFLAPVYVACVTPLMPLVLLTLTVVGLVDNWFNVRATFRPRT